MRLMSGIINILVVWFLLFLSNRHSVHYGLLHCTLQSCICSTNRVGSSLAFRTLQFSASHSFALHQNEAYHTGSVEGIVANRHNRHRPFWGKCHISLSLSLSLSLHSEIKRWCTRDCMMRRGLVWLACLLAQFEADLLIEEGREGTKVEPNSRIKFDRSAIWHSNNGNQTGRVAHTERGREHRACPTVKPSFLERRGLSFFFVGGGCGAAEYFFCKMQ